MEAQAGRVVIAGEDSVEGAKLAATMGALGYRLVYSAAGPRIMQMLVAGGVLDRLYLTVAHRLLGARRYASIVEGERFEPAVDMALNGIYLDPAGLDGMGQLFLSYDGVPTAEEAIGAS
jgi:riboflavin biosynthesis pyrimidine reductase